MTMKNNRSFIINLKALIGLFAVLFMTLAGVYFLGKVSKGSDVSYLTLSINAALDAFKVCLVVSIIYIVFKGARKLM